MKILPSSLREKKRYIAFEVLAEGNDLIDRKALLDEIFFATQTLIGDEGSSEIGYRLMDFDGSRGIMKVSLSAVETARAAMSTVCSIKGNRATIHVLGISGTIRAAIEKYIAVKNIPSTNILSMQVSSEILSGIVVKERGEELELVPDNKEVLKRANTRYVHATSLDLKTNSH